MKKLRLDIEDVRVESFSTNPEEGVQRGTVRGFNTYELGDTCYQYGCTHVDRMCSADCTGVGVYCYTQDPRYYDCTGGNPCTDGGNCTYGACSEGCDTGIC